MNEARSQGPTARRCASRSWWDLLAWDGRAPEVTVAGDGGRKIAGIVAHRTRIDPLDVWTREGIRISSPARTALDDAPLLSRARLRRMLRQAQAEGA